MTTEDTEARYRLPRTVTPSRYELVLEPDLVAGMFDGSEDISVTVSEPVSEIVLNAVDLDIKGGSLRSADGRSIEVGEVRIDPETERATLALTAEAAPGEWTVHLDFRGELNDKLVGFYRSTYQGPDGDTEVIATTHFEATDARRAFPSWDEPDLKAVFGVTLIVAPDLTALSNGPEIERTSLDDGRVRIVFADTMSMSTYLVAFVVGHLELTDAVDAGGVPTRVAHVPGKGQIASFALDVGAHSLTWFADYYGIPYPDAKVDHIALPDFAQGAMENLGCITYREAALLVDPATSTHGEQLDVAETVAHELAHMWFGDLVTMRWWNGLWLNEAFATFMAMLAVDAYRPDWEVWNQFSRSRSAALEVDALASTRSIEYPVHSPDDANGMFDTLTYLKGGAILRMLEQYLGPDRFRDGIRRYLRTHAYGNTETHHLWDALEEETGEPVRRIMDTWIWQGGYPLISVTVADDGTLRFSQRRYSPSRPGDETKWAVPLLVRQVASDGTERTDAILVEADGASLPMLAPDAVVVANAGGISFVRVWYDEVLAGRLAGSAVRELSPLERYALVDDAWAAVVDGSTAASSFCRFVEGFRDETELPVWQLILTGLSWCDRFMEGEPRDRFRDHVRDLLRPSIERLGWETSPDEPDLVRALRGTLAQALAVLGDDPEAKAQMRELRGGVPWRRRCRCPPRIGSRPGGRHERRRRRLRALPADGARRRHAPGATPLPPRAHAVPRPGALRQPARVDPDGRGPVAGRTVPAGDGHHQPGPWRPRLAVHHGPLGRGPGAVRRVEHHLAGFRREVPVAAGAAAGGRGLLPDPYDPPGRSDAGSDPRAPADLRRAPRTRREGPRAGLLGFVVTHPARPLHVLTR